MKVKGKASVSAAARTSLLPRKPRPSSRRPILAQPRYSLGSLALTVVSLVPLEPVANALTTHAITHFLMWKFAKSCVQRRVFGPLQN